VEGYGMGSAGDGGKGLGGRGPAGQEEPLVYHIPAIKCNWKRPRKHWFNNIKSVLSTRISTVSCGFLTTHSFVAVFTGLALDG